MRRALDPPQKRNILMDYVSTAGSLLQTKINIIILHRKHIYLFMYLFVRGARAVAQWYRVRFETRARDSLETLSKILYPLLSTGSPQENRGQIAPK